MERLENLTDHPQSSGPAGDLLSHVLSQIRLTGDHVMPVTVAAGEAFTLAPGAAHVCVVREGRLADAGGVMVETGDLLLMPRGAGGLDLRAADGPATVVVCRFLFDADSLRGMVTALPPHIHIRHAEAHGWMDGIVHFMLLETTDTQPGASLMISRLIDLVVIRALRTWVHRGETTGGWLGGLSDDRIARVLKAIHERPTQTWSIESLAAIAGMSRSSFCDRFAALVGQSPLRYQNEWRLTLARDQLSRRQARVGEVALSIGYESEAAFSRAYKAQFGRSPREDYSAANI